MSIQTDIVDSTSFTNTDDIDAAIAKAFRQISLRMGQTYTEGTDSQVDIIAEDLATYYLHQQLKGRKAKSENIEFDTLMPRAIKQSLDALMVTEDPAKNFKLGRAEPNYSEASWGE